jgi:conjugal transfer/entry exclusion protein
MRKLCGLSLLLVLLWQTAASAQFAAVVYDPANFVQNSISAVQSVITAIQTVLIETNQIIDLTPVSGVITGDGITEDMATLGEIVAQAEGLSYDINQLQAQIADLFNLERPPNSSAMLRERLMEVRSIRHQCYTYAMKTQTLLMTASRTVEHVVALVGSITDYIGNLSATQRMSEAQGVINKTLATQQASTMAYQRAGSVDKMEELLIDASLDAINIRVWDRE